MVGAKGIQADDKEATAGFIDGPEPYHRRGDLKGCC